MADGNSSVLPRGPGKIWRALVWSLKGLRAGFRYESSVRLEIYAIPLFVAAACWLGDSALERVVLIGVLLPVLAAELLNSAIEVLVDKLWPGHDELAGRAKDLGSAAVFVCMVNVIVVWVVLLWPDVAIGR
jgi:diacylglycerol kinase (ATP)